MREKIKEGNVMVYLANFMVYTFAMAGIIAVALLIFKFSTTGAVGGKKSKYLRVIDSMSLAPRKTLYIISAGDEKFLIAGDTDKTSLISKLETSSKEAPQILMNEEKHSHEADSARMTFRETMKNLSKPDYTDRRDIGIKSSILHTKQETSVIKNLAEKIRG